MAKPILITQSEPGASRMAAYFQDAGRAIVKLPMVTINAFSAVDLQPIAKAQHVIVVSAKAVNLCQTTWPKTHAVFTAIGPNTAHALASIAENIQVPVQHDHQGILDLANFKQVANQRIVICSGEAAALTNDDLKTLNTDIRLKLEQNPIQTGTKILQQQLTARGATVQVIDCYQRAIPYNNIEQLQQLLANDALGALSLSSAEAMRNLIVLAGCYESKLHSLPILAISERVAAYAVAWGFNNLEVISTNKL